MTAVLTALVAVAAAPLHIDGLATGAALARTNDEYPKKMFWSGGVFDRLVKHATQHTDDFLGRMWSAYGTKTNADASWQSSLTKAVEFAKLGDWKISAVECASCIVQNPNAIDAKLLRAVAYMKLNQPALALSYSGTRTKPKQQANDSVNGAHKVEPIADGVLHQIWWQLPNEEKQLLMNP